MRDAVFGNVGTTIVFRVGADDAEFLESEFEPEFTPQDIVNLPNYKVYLKLMIDGVTSRPFSAKTLPPLVKLGDKKIEEEVIKSSRALYCRPKEVVEREINEWSEMSIGDDLNPGSGAIEKFPAVCSLCKKDTTVPFRPDPDRAVYCKECIAKIKSGEVKVEKKSENQIKYDEITFFKPLADLGIEFQQKDKAKGEETAKYPERVEKENKPSVFKTIKKVFTTTKPKIPQKSIRENTALREVLNKTLGKPQPEAGQPLAGISLDSLKSKIKVSVSSRDRAANAEDMSKLKDLISKKIEAKKEVIPTPPPSTDLGSTVSSTTTPIPKKPKTREVPEDVLRKILE